MLSFTERMDLGRELAQVARNRGKAGGTVAKGWGFKRALPDCQAGSWEALCLVARQSWRAECTQIRVDFASACLNRLDDQPDTWEGLL